MSAQPAGDVRELSMSEALNEALRQEMERDASVFAIGEDIGMHGGLFGVTAGLLDRFGPERVVDSPISEAGITGAGVGAALVGCRPVVELQIFDFVTIAMDQLVNHAAKWRYMSGGQVSVPLVVRGPISNGIGMAAQHSQTLEAWFVHTPGLIVMMPSTPADAKGLLTSAIREPNPVVLLEKRLLYARRGPVPEGEHVVPIGVAEIKRPGRDVTVVAAGMCVHQALQAARTLAREGVEVEVIDPRTLKPLDIETIAGSVERTGRLVVVNEGARAGGFASEVVARVVETSWGALRAEPQRVTSLDTPIPYAAGLERAVLPSVADVEEAIRRTLDRALMRGLAGRCAIVTGAASGIGAATAARLAQAGAAVVLGDIADERGRAVAAALEAAGGAVAFQRCDVAREDDWRALAVLARARFGGIDAVVNNAYANVVCPTIALEPADWRRMLDVNIGQVYHSVRACLPDLAERRGAMVNVASVHAHVGFDGHAGYDAAKGAICALTRELAVELGPAVRVNAVLPGPIITGIWDDIDEDERAASAAMTTLARNGQPDEVAAAIAFLLSDEASYISGTELVVDGGWSITKHTRPPLPRHSG